MALRGSTSGPAGPHPAPESRRPERLRRRHPVAAVAAAAIVAALALSGCSILPSAEAHGDPDHAVAVATPDPAEEGAGAIVPVIECPGIDDLLADVPAEAQAEVDRELANLENGIANAQARLDDEFARAQADAEGGDENAGAEATARFLEIADVVLTDLSESKRPAALSRIETAIERAGGVAADLVSRAGCNLVADDGAEDEGGEDGDGAEDGDGDEVAGQAIVCPDVASVLTDVPADAADEVERELAALDSQLARANERLAKSVGQGGPNFVQNAILGPLGNQRAAVLNRIEIAIDRVGGAAPEGLADLAECAVEDGAEDGAEGDDAAEDENAQGEDENAAEGDEAEDENGQGEDENADDEGDEGDDADENEAIDCEDVAAQLADVPAAAVTIVQEQVQRIEQNVSLADQAAVKHSDRSEEWLEANIVDVLVSVRIEIVQRIEIAVAVNGGDVPEELEDLAAACELTTV